MSVFTQEVWAALIPHAGTMALLDVAVEWNASFINAMGAGHTLASSRQLSNAA